MRKIKVVHFTSGHGPFNNRVFKECSTIAAAGYDVTLVVPSEHDEFSNGVSIHAVPLPRGRLDRMTRTVWNIYREAVWRDGDIYQFHDPELIPAGLLLRLRSKKVIFDIHENVPNQIRVRGWIPGYLRGLVASLYNWLERWAARQWSAIVTANEDISERFQHVSVPVTTIHNYSELDEFAGLNCSPPRYKSRTIIHCGGISVRTSIHSAVQAMALLPNSLQARLVVTGVCDSNALLRDIQQLPGWGRVDWQGRIPRTKMVSLLADASAALVLYGPGDNHLNVRSNRFFESLAAGLPVITPNYPAWKDAVEAIGCGICVDPRDAQAVADAIHFLFTHPVEAAAMGRRGRAIVLEKFNWGSEQAKLLTLYCDLSAGLQALDTAEYSANVA